MVRSEQMNQVFMKNTKKSTFPYKAVNARGSGGIYARDRGFVAGNNLLLSRTAAVVARVHRSNATEFATLELCLIGYYGIEAVRIANAPWCLILKR